MAISVRLDQWADGPAPDGDSTGKNNEAFVNGNLNAQKAHYNEGDSIPYRVVVDDLSNGVTYTVKIQWDTVDSGAYAIDYLTSFNFSFDGTKHPGEPDVTPTIGINDLSSGLISYANILSDPQLEEGFGAQFGVTDGLASGQPDGQQVFTIFGAVSNVSAGAITYNADHTKASTTVTFTYTGSNANNADSVVVAWGGHIASSLAWSDDLGETVETASDISGSPYHTRVLSLFQNGVETSIGNQDRSLSADAVIAPPVAGDVSLLADEDNITGGNNDVQTGDDVQAGLTGTLPVTEATSVNFAALSGTSVFDTSNVAVTSSGVQLKFFWDGASRTLYASTDITNLTQATTTAAFKIQVAASSPFTYTFTLLDQVDHPDTGNVNTEDPNVLIDLTYTAVGVGTDTGVVHVTIDDDIPIASTAQQTGTVDEDGVPGGIAGGTGDVAGEATVATGSVAPLFNSGADQPLSFSLNTVTSGLPQTLTSGGVAVTYAVVGNTLTASAGAGNTVFTFALNATSGAWTFTLVDQLDHPTLNGQTGDNTENDLTINLSSILQATDKDGDTVAAAANALIVTVDDDTPTASQAQQTGTVDEDGVPGGIAGGTGDVAGEATVATGSVAPLFNSGADQPLSFSLNTVTSGLPQTLTSGGVAVTYAVVGNTLTASAGAGNTVFTFALNATSGAWTFTLVDQLDHPTLNGQTGDNTENDLTINLSSILQATDKDGDTVAAAANALIVTVDDDTPTISAILDGSVDFVQGDSVTNSLNGLSGADALATFSVTASPETITIFDGTDAELTLLRNINPDATVITYFQDNDDSQTRNAGDTDFFKLTLSGGNYTFDVLQDVPSFSFPLDFQAIASGGPQEVLTVPTSDGSHNIIFDGLIVTNLADLTDLANNPMGGSTADDLNPDNVGFGVKGDQASQVNQNEGFFATAEDANGDAVEMSGLSFDIAGIGNVPDVIVNVTIVDDGTETVLNPVTVPLPNGNKTVNFNIEPGDTFDSVYVAFTGLSSTEGVRLLNFETKLPIFTPDESLDFTVQIADFDGDTAQDTFSIDIAGNQPDVIV